MTVRRLFAAIAGAVALPGASLSGQDSLPPAVASAFHQTYPAARVLNVSKERRDGKVVYEIESRDGETRRDLIYSTTGAVLEIEERIPVDSVPAVVRAAAERRVAGGKLVGAERVTRGTVILFEVQLRLNGRSRFLTYDPEGKAVD
ncbi:MAG TPA: PepSY-like domain-containing protein [Gemmatimonadales bacterium]|nr:PepSY-like domain-containing protein [Gemmatimonadales bacterium]